MPYVNLLDLDDLPSDARKVAESGQEQYGQLLNTWRALFHRPEIFESYGEWERLQPEIRRYEPREAFLSGEDGLDAIRDLIAAAPAGTQVALEHGNDQGRDVRDMLDDASSYPDLANWERITVGRVR